MGRTKNQANACRGSSIIAMAGLASLIVLSFLYSACASGPAPKTSVNPPAAPIAEQPKRLEQPTSAPVAAAPVPPSEPRPVSISAKALNLYRTMDDARKPPTDDELLVIDSAKKLIGKAPNAKVVVKGRQFTLDCIGTVGAIFYRMDIDIGKDFDKYPGNGVNRFYMTLKDKGVLHRDKYPRVGDVIVWDNTWDANGDGYRTKDPRTHAGVVLAVDDDGTIYYVHENMFRGVVIEVMNLLQPTVEWDPSGKRLNSGLAIAAKPGGPKPEHWLSGDVFNTFGDVLRIKDDLKVADARRDGSEPGAVAMAR